MDNLLEIDYNRYQESNAYLKNSIILIRENLCRSGEMCINFLCLILSESWSKINAIYDSNFSLRESILGILELILGFRDLILGLWELSFCRWESIFGALGVVFLPLGIDFWFL